MPNLVSTEDRPDLNDHNIVSVLVENHRSFLTFLASRLSSRADAEDVLQDFCLKVLLRKEQLREADSMMAWLYTLLRSTLVDYYRKTGRQRNIQQAYATELKTAEIPTEHSELHDKLCDCLCKLLPVLHPAQADLVRRVDLEEEPRASVAADLDVAPGTLSVRLHRARRALRHALLTACSSCVEHGFDDCACYSIELKLPESSRRAVSSDL